MLGRDVNPVEIADMFAAKRRLSNYVAPTPLVSLETLNIQLDAPVRLKIESVMPGGAYKYRGAMNKSMSLIEKYGKDIRIIAASSGNHGMACAIAGKTLGIGATVVVPEITPEIKKNCIRSLGADLLVAGKTYDESFITACELAEKEKMYYVHPTSDKQTVGGQGTIGLEIVEQFPKVDQVLVPIGGGGLIVGIAYALKTLKPGVRVVGVMPAGSAVYYESRKAGKLLVLDQCASIADAVVRRTGEEYLYPYVEEYVDEIVTVEESTIRQAIQMAALHAKLVLEGAAALALAAILEKKCSITKGTVLLCSGGNIDRALLEACLKG